MDRCKNKPEYSATTKVGKHIPSGFSTSMSSFKDIEDKHDVYRAKACMKTFCQSLRRQARKPINFKKKK